MDRLKTAVIGRKELRRMFLLVACLALLVIAIWNHGEQTATTEELDEPPGTTDQQPNGSAADVNAAERWYQQSCSLCHGEALEGRMQNPAIIDSRSKYTEDEIYQIIINGKRDMPGGFLQGDEAKKVAEWIYNYND